MSDLVVRTYEVNYSHIDNRGVARPSFLFDAMQDAATVAAGEMHLGRDELDIIWVLSRLRLTLDRPLWPYERVRCETWCPGVRGAAWTRMFSFSVDGTPVAGMQSMWVMLDPDSHRILRPTAIPGIEGLLHTDRGEVPAPLPKLPCVQTQPHHVHTVGYADLDVNNHLNNVRAVELVSDALDLQAQDGFVSSLQVNYTAETAFGSAVELSCGTDGENRYVCGAVDGQTHFEALAAFRPIGADTGKGRKLL